MADDITIIRTNGSEDREGKSLELCLQEESIQEQAKNARELFSSLQGELDNLEDDLKDGLSYLDMKNDTLLSYMIDLCNIMLRKVSSDCISGHASVERSVYYRTILEKIKAIDLRLAYQLNKVISMPDEVSEENQAVDVKNLDIDIQSGDDSNDSESDSDKDNDESEELDGSSNEEGSESGEKESEDVMIRKNNPKGGSNNDGKPVGIYRPPKLRSVAYNDGKGGSSSKNRHVRDEFNLGDLGNDDDDDQDIFDETHVKRDVDRTRFEEDNYMRLPEDNPKKAKRKMRAKMAAGKGKKKFKGNKRKNKW